MNDQQTSPDDWQSCAPGTLQNLARQQRRTRNVAAAKRLTAPIVAVVVLFAVGMWIAPRFSAATSEPGEILCAEVAGQMPAFAANQLDAAMTRKIEDHLAHCPHCRAKLRELKASTAQRAVKSSIASNTKHTADAPHLRVPLATVLTNPI